MLRYNEERIGRFHVYFQSDEFNPYPNPKPRSEGGSGSSPYSEGSGGMGSGADRMSSTGRDRFCNRYGTGDPMGATMGGDAWTGGGLPVTTSDGANYTNINITGTSSIVTPPSSAAEAQAAARSGSSEAAGRAATERSSGTGAIRERMNVATITEETTLTTKDTLTNLPNNILGRGSVQDRFRQQLDTARKTGLRDAQAILERGGTMDEAIDAYLSKVADEGVMRTPYGSYTRLNNNLFLADLQGIRDAFGATAAETATSTAAASSRDTATAAVEEGVTKENAAEKGAETAKEALKDNADDAKKGGQGTSKGIAEALIEAAVNGKIDTQAAAIFQIGQQIVMAENGMATSMKTGIERKQATISAFMQTARFDATDENNIAESKEQVDSFITAQEKNALIELAAEMGLSQQEIQEINEKLDVINDTTKSVEERAETFKDLVENLLDKFNNASSKGKCAIYKMLISMFEKQIDRATDYKNKQKATAEFFKQAKDASDPEIAEALETRQELKEEIKKEVTLAAVMEKECERIKGNITLEDLQSNVTEESEGVYQAARARLVKFGKGRKIGEAIMQGVEGLIMMPFAPRAGIKMIRGAFKAIADNDEVATQAVPEGASLEEMTNDPQVRKDLIELGNKAGIMWDNADEAYNLSTAIEKDILKMFLSLMSGNVLGFVANLIKTIFDSIRLASYSTEPKITLEDGSIFKGFGDLGLYETDGGYILPENQIRLITSVARYGYITHYENKYQRDWQQGGNTNQESYGGYNYGIGSDEEMANIIRNNIAHDRITRAMVTGL